MRALGDIAGAGRGKNVAMDQVLRGLGFARIQFTDGKSAVGSTVDGAAAAQVLDYRFVAGSFEDLTADGLLVSTGEAKRRSLQIGSTVQVEVDNENRWYVTDYVNNTISAYNGGSLTQIAKITQAANIVSIQSAAISP